MTLPRTTASTFSQRPARRCPRPWKTSTTSHKISSRRNVYKDHLHFPPPQPLPRLPTIDDTLHRYSIHTWKPHTTWNLHLLQQLLWSSVYGRQTLNIQPTLHTDPLGLLTLVHRVLSGDRQTTQNLSTYTQIGIWVSKSYHFTKSLLYCTNTIPQPLIRLPLALLYHLTDILTPQSSTQNDSQHYK